MIYDKLPVVFLSTIASERKDSTNSQIATYILNNLDKVQNMGIKEIAKECNVAVSSISRFCKEIGLRDFVELRELLVSTKLYYQDDSNSSNSKERMLDYCDKVKSSIDMVTSSIDMNKINDLCQDIKKYQRVAIFGLLKAGAVAINLQGDLLMLGKQVYTNISYPQQIDYITNASENDLVIILSYTGSYFDYQDLRSLTKRLNKPTIWFISSGKKEILPFINKVISFDSLQDQTSHPYQLQFIAGLIAQEYSLIDKLK
ncbi:MAG: MurR/RpiR family transcriptional regulator [Thomasclavelia sp.]|nr:MurR/RpiR family transcriptional regulator [Thomasclavelia sp.]